MLLRRLFRRRVNQAQQRSTSTRETPTDARMSSEANDSPNPLTPFQVLSQMHIFRNEDEKAWWDSTGPVFVKMMADANYDIHHQYKYLTLHQNYVVPFLGPFPREERKDRWMSNITPYGLPFELSLNCSHNIIRYSFEPVTARAGTTEDPFNKTAMDPCLEQLLELDSGIDTTWFNHFRKELVVTEEQAVSLVAQDKVRPGPGKGQHHFAIDLQDGKFMFKAYFYPPMKSMATGVPVEKLLFDSIRKGDIKGSLADSIATLKGYLESTRRSGDDPSPGVTSLFVSCDMIDPSEARLKYYVLDQHVSWQRVEDLWTLGGRRSGDPSNAAGLAILKELWDLLQVPEGFRDMSWGYCVLGEPPKHLLPTFANFTLQPNHPNPEPQVYLVTFGMNDMHVADALTVFFERVGWTELAKNYKKNLCSY